MKKETLRTEISAQRTALSASLWQENNAAIRTQLLQSNSFHKCNCVFTYISIHTEVDTRALMNDAWARGKQVAVPITAIGGQMYFVDISPDTPLHKTKFGTLEPSLPASAAIHPVASDLFLVPGLVFDAQGNRYGYGGGFYDRYLAAHPDVNPIALAFSFQIHDQTLDTQPHDLPMAAVLSEKSWVIPPQSNFTP
ncbi:MAG: 5-formyltetrahydrofolate cyclo-ligase [Faecalibacterium sp.]